MRPSFLLLFFCATSVGAQVSDSLPVGSRLRVTARSWRMNRELGRFAGLGDDTLRFVRYGSDTAAIPLSALTQLHAIRGTHHRWGQGMLMGLGTGVAIGALGAAIFVKNETNCQPLAVFCGNEKSFAMMTIGAAGGLVGMLVGGVVGTTKSSDRWVRVHVRGKQISF